MCEHCDGMASQRLVDLGSRPMGFSGGGLGLPGEVDRQGFVWVFGWARL